MHFFQTSQPILRSLCAATLLLCGPASQAAEKDPIAPPDMNPKEIISQNYVKQLRTIVKHEIVQMMLKSQNVRHKDIVQSDIIALDKKWRAERKVDDKPLIAATLSNPLSVYLLRMQARAGGLYSEIFIMDSKGLNVGQSGVTSDYWQGDEGKWQKTFLAGGEAIFIDEAEWHKGSRTWRAQVNLAIPDAKSGKAIGAATFEINLTELQRRAGA